MRKQKTFPSGWKTFIDTPCPLLAPCIDCGTLYPVTEFYPSKQSGRKTILGSKIISLCKSCNNERYKNMDRGAKLCHPAKQRARRFGIAFDITQTDITIPDTCPVLGIPIYDYTGTGRAKGNRNRNAATLDRLDNSKGYTKDNVHVVSMRANTLKSDGSLVEFANILMYMLQHNGELTAEEIKSLKNLRDCLGVVA